MIALLVLGGFALWLAGFTVGIWLTGLENRARDLRLIDFVLLASWDTPTAILRKFTEHEARCVLTDLDARR